MLLRRRVCTLAFHSSSSIYACILYVARRFVYHYSTGCAKGFHFNTFSYVVQEISFALRLLVCLL